MERLAALIHFREDVSDEEAREALEKISGVLSLPTDYDIVDGKMQYKKGSAGDYVHSYDDEYGGPVWYIP